MGMQRWTSKRTRYLCLVMGCGTASTGKWWWLGSWQTSGWSGRTPTPRQKWLRGKMVKISHNRQYIRSIHCAQWRFYIYCLPRLVFTILPLNHFCPGVSVLLDHPLVCQLPSHHHLPVLAMPYPITRQRNLFCLFVHYGIPIRIRVGILSHYPLWHAPSDSNLFFPILGGMSSQ